MIVFATPAVAKPTVETKVEYKTVVKKSQAAELTAAVSPAALATTMVAELKKADATLTITAADMTVTKATTIEIAAPQPPPTPATAEEGPPVAVIGGGVGVVVIILLGVVMKGRGTAQVGAKSEP